MKITAPRCLQRTDPRRVTSGPGGTSPFPGPWVGGVAMLAGPVLLLIGTFLRIGYDFFFTDQLRGFAEDPALMTASYNCWLAGDILLWPAVLVLAHRIARTRPRWATWAAVMVLMGLFARSYHYGAGFLAFQLVELRGLPAATAFIGDAYGDATFQVIRYLTFTIMFGWYVLAVAAYLSRTLGAVRAIGLGTMSLVPLGMLKGTETMTVIGAIGLCVALLPTGVELLRDAVRRTRRPRRADVGFGLLAAVAVLALAELGTYG
ncbi:hypothetical protein [Pseudonocardia sp. MH-G8]|uniref:hypothetical protein n=1 Tax=Pseudonocardia sp. MH-G8 TaxID=1854588 RepID=UPI000BA0870B|nr:hypothetical protein [Pseudonocardia sp. MH-G8]OZM83881.1 hypothetical protein CFP66_05395 [Pseudonocardia sp. MH-G8]